MRSRGVDVRALAALALGGVLVLQPLMIVVPAGALEPARESSAAAAASSVGRAAVGAVQRMLAVAIPAQQQALALQQLQPPRSLDVRSLDVPAASAAGGGGGGGSGSGSGGGGGGCTSCGSGPSAHSSSTAGGGISVSTSTPVSVVNPITISTPQSVASGLGGADLTLRDALLLASALRPKLVVVPVFLGG